MRGFLSIILLLNLALLSSQNPQPVYRNLVPNSSFENYRKKSMDVRKAVPWQQIESVDYYQNPLSNDTTAEKGAFDGECYTGFRFRKNYKEFLQVRLTEPLHRGVTYEFSMYIRLAFWSNASLRSFGALISKGGYHAQKDAVKGSMIDSLCESAAGLRNDYRWIRIAGFYKADGGEKYLSIGNFSTEIKKDMIRLGIFRFGPLESYYFVDDISLSVAPQFLEKVTVQRIGPEYFASWADTVLSVRPDLQVGETITLNHISFVDGKSYLLPESYSELNKLAAYLLCNPGLEIRINGHSDNSGLRLRNQKISELRAREVFEYLIKKGVQNKMHFRGLGSTMPIADNNTEEGRRKNQRVEFEIIRK